MKIIYATRYLILVLCVLLLNCTLCRNAPNFAYFCKTGFIQTLNICIVKEPKLKRLCPSHELEYQSFTPQVNLIFEHPAYNFF